MGKREGENSKQPLASSSEMGAPSNSNNNKWVINLYPVSPRVANLYMEYFERKAVGTTSIPQTLV